MLILPYETLIILQRLHQWNPINTVTNGPKKIGRNNEVTVLTRVSAVLPGGQKK